MTDSMWIIVLALAIPLAASLENGAQVMRVRRSGRARVGMPGGFFDVDLSSLNGEQRQEYENVATRVVSTMNDVYMQEMASKGVSNAAPLRHTDIVSLKTQVVAGTNYDLKLKIVMNGQTKKCRLWVSHLYPWIDGGTWEVKSWTEGDPCRPYTSGARSQGRQNSQRRRNSQRTRNVQRNRRSTQLLGGEEEIESSDAMVQEAAQWAVEHINEMSNSLFRQALLNIGRVTKQVVNGYRYRFQLTVVSTSCRNAPENKHKTLEECPANDNPVPQDCDVSVVFSQGQYTMENFHCKAHENRIGGDDHDYKPHGSGLIGGDDHDYKPHGKIGGDDHDYKPHGKIGGDDHDYKPHGKMGGDDHDYKPHGNGLLGGDDHDYKPHGDGLMGGDDHDYKPHGGQDRNLLGQDLHDYIPHLGKLAGSLNSVVGGVKESTLKFGKGFLNSGHAAVKHMSILGGDTHDYLPHGDDQCGEHVAAFMDFKSKYNRVYGDPEEEAKRFKVFCENMEKVKDIQKNEGGSAQYGATKFADISEEEFKKQYLGFNPALAAGHQLPQAEIPTDPIPDSWDWRDHGAVTPVKNQGMCGSCWAFSVTGNIEGQWAIRSSLHKLLSLSEQELVDCDTLDEGCNGGLPSNAYIALMKLGGIETESDYAYEGHNEKCKFNTSQVVVKVTGAVNISKDEGEMAAWLYKNGPISIGINAFAMQFYMGGIAHPWRIFCNPKGLDHGVLIVGYGKQGNKPYWIIKNSWGEGWGRDGYYYVYRGDGTCGLNTMCTSATVV